MTGPARRVILLAGLTAGLVGCGLPGMTTTTRVLFVRPLDVWLAELKVFLAMAPRPSSVSDIVGEDALIGEERLKTSIGRTHMPRMRAYGATSLVLMLIGLTTLTTQTAAHGDIAAADFSLASIRSGRARVSDAKTDEVHRALGAESRATVANEQLGVALLESGASQGVANLSLLQAAAGAPVAAAVGHEQGVTLSWMQNSMWTTT